MKKFLLIQLMASVFLLTTSNAADMTWEGRYRWEGISVKDSSLKSGETSKAYMLHHLILEPKIVAADGVNIYGRFDILNSNSYPDSQMGQFLGQGPGTSPSSSQKNSNVLSRTQKQEPIQVTYAYLNWINEYSVLTLGRAPIHFGLGMTHHSGQGDFDHWIDTKDLVGYKVFFGNLSVMPMIGKVNEGSLSQEDDVSDYMVEVKYENPESKLGMGLFYEARVGTNGGGNDAPATQIAGPGASVVDGWEGRRINLFVTTKTDELSFGVEAGFLDGNSGVQNSAGQRTSLNSFGIASETKWDPTGSRWNLGLLAGYATGDDPNTTDRYEGFLFNRNYDVGTLLFNHSLGSFDIFRTGLAGKGTYGTRGDGHDEADTETVSNVFYLSPKIGYEFSSTWLARAHVLWATLSQQPLTNSDVNNSVGTEWGLGLDYQPYPRFKWGFDFALFVPGDAFKGGSNHYSTDSALGFMTKAAVSF